MHATSGRTAARPQHEPVERPRTWEDLARVVEQFVDTDDPRLEDLVLDLERRAGCPLGGADRSAVMMGRRFARAHRHAVTETLPPDVELALNS